MSVPPVLRHPAGQSLLLFLLAFLVLGPGIGTATGFTGKDEFFLGLRTPMEMIEGNHWLVPFLDCAPRIRKPPLLYWLGRAGYETFGISLIPARTIAIAFAGLLIVATAGIARRLSGKPETGWLAGCILLGCLGMFTEGRRFMLDVPVAALSAAALWAFIQWLDFRRFFALTAAALLLAAGFLAGVPALLTAAALVLVGTVSAFLVVTARALLGVPSTSPTIRGLKLAMFGLGGAERRDRQPDRQQQRERGGNQHVAPDPACFRLARVLASASITSPIPDSFPLFLQRPRGNRRRRPQFLRMEAHPQLLP